MRTKMHEWPLVLFTAMAVAGGGSLAAQPLLVTLGAMNTAMARAGAGWAAALLGVGLVVSLSHVGQKRRLPLASRRFGASALSTEVVLAGVSAAAGAMLAWSPMAWLPTSTLIWLSGAASTAFLLSLGVVYRLRGQVTWPGVAFVGPLLTGLAFGFVAHAATVPPVMPLVLGPTLLLLGTDALVFGVRWIAVARVRPWHTVAHPAIFRHRHLLLVHRLVLVTLAPAVLLAIGQPTMADLSLGVGLLADRLAFYALAAQHTTEAEIARVEQLIESRRMGDRDSGS